jgi:winged helix-turn-helix protein
VQYSLSGVYELLHRLNLAVLVPRPQHRHNDHEAMRQWAERARKVSLFSPSRNGPIFSSPSQSAGLILVLSMSQIMVDNSQSNHSRNFSCVSSSGHNFGSRIQPLSCSRKIHSQYLSSKRPVPSQDRVGCNDAATRR